MGRAVEPDERKGWASRRRAAVWLVLWAGLACVLVATFALSRRERAPGEGLAAPPADVVGLWTTKDPRYAGRSLRVSDDTVVLGVGSAGAPRRREILSTRAWREGLVRVLRIEYDAGEGPETMELLLVGPDSMRLRNPREALWTRAH